MAVGVEAVLEGRAQLSSLLLDLQQAIFAGVILGRLRLAIRSLFCGLFKPFLPLGRLFALVLQLVPRGCIDTIGLVPLGWLRGNDFGRQVDLGLVTAQVHRAVVVGVQDLGNVHGSIGVARHQALTVLAQHEPALAMYLLPVGIVLGCLDRGHAVLTPVVHLGRQVLVHEDGGAPGGLVDPPPNPL